MKFAILDFNNDFKQNRYIDQHAKLNLFDKGKLKSVRLKTLKA